MLLRSSSTPVAQALFSDSPNRGFDSNINNTTLHTTDLCITKISVLHGVRSLSSFSCHSSPDSLSNSWFPDFSPKSNSLGRKNFRRALSDSNLEELASTSLDIKEVWSSRTLVSKSLHKHHHKSMLHTQPSFSIYNTDDNFEEDGENGDSGEGKLERSATIGESIEGEFSFRKSVMCKIEEGDNEQDEEERKGNLGRFKDLKIELEGESMSHVIYHDTGTGIVGNGIDGGIEPSNFNDAGDLENYYKRMVREDPSNPLFMRNYAQLLQSKRDFLGAEEYYSRAILGDPKDGQTLMQYAKLMWQLYRDQDRASTYFERAAQASPEDSDVLAAHASFLWEIDSSEDEDYSPNDPSQIEENTVQIDLQRMDFEEVKRPASPTLHLAMGLGIDVASFHSGIGTDVEEYYRRMVDENPRNNLFLRNYAKFLHQSKGDLIGAAELYSRAILADPYDGEIISQYANLVWLLHHDKDRAVSYFERAVQATPEDSNVLASYAKFLWETEDESEDIL
ncbi:Tetratricopeptide repeat (TPR)-like superfamily protein [Abeliophyllum distichum]|uniref:Tetratricopeptide repeat (TPR)-like superfamily protein n=1 Tax=Abeliophyllum distichum TaxID=126358 RepID=A0ABD1Q078_9LAMI